MTVVVAAGLALCAAPPASAQAPAATVHAAGHEASITVGGLLQVQGEMGDRGDSRWGNAGDRIFLRRARFSVSAKFLEEWDGKVEGEFAGSPSPAVNLRSQLTDAYVNWNRYPQANVRAGQFKTPFGFEQLWPDPQLPLAERALASDRISLGRQLGVQVSGDFRDKRYGYAIGEFNGNGVNGSANDDDRFTAAARLWAKPVQTKWSGRDLAWGVGVAGYHSKDHSVLLSDFPFDSTPDTIDRDSVFEGTRRGAEVDTQVTLGRVDFWAEVFRARFEPKNELPRPEFDSEGSSFMAIWSIVPNRWQAVLRYEEFDPFTHFGGDDTNTWTLGGNFLIKGHDLKLVADVLGVDAPGRDREYRLVTRVQAVF